jgi:biopolymer transport protein ExbB
MKRIVGLLLLLVVAGVLFAQTPPTSPSTATETPAESATETEDTSSRGKEVSLWNTIKAGGIIGLIIILESLVAMGLIVEHFMSLRQDRFVPPMLERQIQTLLDDGNVSAATELSKGSRSLLGITIAAGLERHGGVFGFFEMQSSMREAAEREVARLHRKLEYISFIAATAPMMGLLGTVTGMISAFNIISLTGGTAKPSQLAGGISEALVTTCMGLIVAIPTMFFASLFRNRIDGCVSETEAACERLTSGFRTGGPTP